MQYKEPTCPITAVQMRLMGAKMKVIMATRPESRWHLIPTADDRAQARRRVQEDIRQEIAILPAENADRNQFLQEQLLHVHWLIERLDNHYQ